MKNKIFYLAITLLVSCASMNYINKKNSFYFTFGSCFKNDTIIMKINDEILIQDIVLNSDFSTGIVIDKKINYNGKALKYISEGEVLFTQNIKINNEFSMEIIQKDNKTEFFVDLSSGKYLIVDNCGNPNFLELNQYESIPVVE